MEEWTHTLTPTHVIRIGTPSFEDVDWKKLRRKRCHFEIRKAIGIGVAAIYCKACRERKIENTCIQLRVHKIQSTCMCMHSSQNSSVVATSLPSALGMGCYLSSRILLLPVSSLTASKQLATNS